MHSLALLPIAIRLFYEGVGVNDKYLSIHKRLLKKLHVFRIILVIVTIDRANFVWLTNNPLLVPDHLLSYLDRSFLVRPIDPTIDERTCKFIAPRVLFHRRGFKLDEEH